MSEDTSGSRPVTVIAGAGPGNGAALARRFAEAGYRTALLARDLDRTKALADQIDGSTAFVCDVGDAASIKAAFAGIRAQLGEVDTLGV